MKHQPPTIAGPLFERPLKTIRNSFLIDLQKCFFNPPQHMERWIFGLELCTKIGHSVGIPTGFIEKGINETLQEYNV